MKKIFVKTSRTNGVIEILWAGQESSVTPPELKPTLNMFRGQQFPACFKSLIEYATNSIKAQEGDKDAQLEIERIHYEINHKEVE